MGSIWHKVSGIWNLAGKFSRNHSIERKQNGGLRGSFFRQTHPRCFPLSCELLCHPLGELMGKQLCSAKGARRHITCKRVQDQQRHKFGDAVMTRFVLLGEFLNRP